MGVWSFTRLVSPESIWAWMASGGQSGMSAIRVRASSSGFCRRMQPWLWARLSVAKVEWVGVSCR